MKSILSSLRLRLTVIIKYNKLNNIAKREGAKDVKVPAKSILSTLRLRFIAIIWRKNRNNTCEIDIIYIQIQACTDCGKKKTEQ